MSAISIFSAMKRANSVSRLDHETFTVVCGSLEFDFTQRQLAPGDHYLEMTTVFGSATLCLPDNVAISASGAFVFGNINDERPVDSTTAPVHLHIRAICVGGDVRIKRRSVSSTEDVDRFESSTPYPTLTDQRSIAASQYPYEQQTSTLQQDR